MALSLAEKLRIKEGMHLLTINAPDIFMDTLQPLPSHTVVSSNSKNFDQVHWFVQTRAEMEKQLDKVLNLLKDGTICWIYYPKGSSTVTTDLTRDEGWENLLKHKELQWLSLISFDKTWSAFGMRKAGESSKKKKPGPKEREIFQYIDSSAKTIRLPDDLEAAFKEQKDAEKFFNSLSFTNRKEFVEWIVTAKREETRKERVNGTIERLTKHWKNPRNR